MKLTSTDDLDTGVPRQGLWAAARLAAAIQVA